MLGRGDGTFSTAATVPLAGGPVVVDLDEDSKLDLACSSGHDAVGVELGAGDGTFKSAPPAYPSGGSLNLTLADLNGDHALDVIAGGASQISVNLNRGDGTFAPPRATAIDGSAVATVAADVNGDGNLDLVVLEGPTVLVLHGRGDGTFDAPLSVAMPGSAIYNATLAVADFNGDGLGDIIVGSSQVYGFDSYYGNDELVDPARPEQRLLHGHRRAARRVSSVDRARRLQRRRPRRPGHRKQRRGLHPPR